MKLWKTSAVVVVERSDGLVGAASHRIAGLVTERDVVKALIQGCKTSTVKAEGKDGEESKANTLGEADEPGAPTSTKASERGAPLLLCGRLRDIMTPADRLRCASEGDSADDALGVMAELKCRHLPVTTATGGLVRVWDALSVSEALLRRSTAAQRAGGAVIRHVNRLLALFASTQGDARLGGPVSSTLVASTAADVPVMGALVEMRRLGTSALVVIDRDRLVGIFTERDV